MSESEDFLSRAKIQSSSDLTEVGLRTRATPLMHAFRERLPFPNEMRDIQEHFGIEIATTVFLMALESVQPYAPFIRKVRSALLATTQEFKAKAKNFEVLVVASNDFSSGRKWGDHVETWTAWARSMGFTTDWVPTDTKNSVSDNARLLSRYLINHPHPNRILVTYGQGAAEVRNLLLNRLGERGRGEKRTDQEFDGIRLWLNVCGSYGGSASVELASKTKFSKVLKSISLALRKRNPVVLDEMHPRSANVRRIPYLPSDMGVVNVIGLPLKSQVPMGFHRPYLDLSRQGPNDGVLSLYQMIAYPGLILPIPAMGHTASELKLEPIFKRCLSVFVEGATIRPNPSESKQNRRPDGSLSLELR